MHNCQRKQNNVGCSTYIDSLNYMVISGPKPCSDTKTPTNNNI